MKFAILLLLTSLGLCYGWGKSSSSSSSSSSRSSSSSSRSSSSSSPSDNACPECCDEDEINAVFVHWALARHHFVKLQSNDTTSLYASATEVFVDLNTPNTLRLGLGPGWRQNPQADELQEIDGTGGQINNTVTEFIDTYWSQIIIPHQTDIQRKFHSLVMYHEVDMGYEITVECGTHGANDRAIARGMVTEIYHSLLDEHNNFEEDTDTLYQNRYAELERVDGIWKIAYMDSQVF